MIVSVRYTPRLFGRAVVASFKDKPVVNGLILLFGLLLAGVAAGPLHALFALLAGAAIALLVTLLGGAVLYFLYRNKRKVVPVSFDLSGKNLKITYGDRSSRRRSSQKLSLENIERVRFRGGAILIRHKGFVHTVTIPEDSRSRFIEEMRRHGWFDRITPEPRLRQLAGGPNIMLYILAVLVIVASIPTHQDNQVILSNHLLRKTLTPANVVAAVDSQRNAFSLGAVQPDATLTNAAAAACKDMTDHTYFGDLSTPQNVNVYTKGIYVDRWVNEVGAAAHDSDSPDQVASRWVNNGTTSNAILDSSAVHIGAAVCRYTVNGSYDDIIVVELGS